MAGRVQVDCFTHTGAGVVDLVARECRVTGRYGPICQRYDPKIGEVRWCPLMYGLEITSEGWHYGEARTPGEAASWMAASELYAPRTYRVLCLAGPDNATPGATHCP